MKRKENTDKAIAKLKQIHAKCLLCCNKPEGAHIIENMIRTTLTKTEWSG